MMNDDTITMNSMIQRPARTTMTKNKNWRQPTLHSYIKDEFSSRHRKRTRLSSTVAAKIPAASIVVEHVLPFLQDDRSTWNAVTSASKELYEASRQLLPPWPTQRLIVSTRRIKSTAIAPIAFDPSGIRIAVLTLDDSITLYDRRKGYLKTLLFYNNMNHTEDDESIFDRIYLLDPNTIVIVCRLGAIYWKIDNPNNFINVSGNIKRNNCNFVHGPSLKADISYRGDDSGGGCQYLVTTHTVSARAPEQIRIQQLGGSQQHDGSAVWWIRYPLRNTTIKCLQIVASSVSIASNHNSSWSNPSSTQKPTFVTISDDGDIHGWVFDKQKLITNQIVADSDSIADKRKINKVLLHPISYGKIPIHNSDEVYIQRFQISTAATTTTTTTTCANKPTTINEGKGVVDSTTIKLRITEMVEREYFNDDNITEDSDDMDVDEDYYDEETSDDDSNSGIIADDYCIESSSSMDDEEDRNNEPVVVERQVLVWEQKDVNNDNNDSEDHSSSATPFVLKHDYRINPRDFQPAVTNNGRIMATLSKGWNLNVLRLDAETDEDYQSPKLVRKLEGCYHFDGCTSDNSYSFRYDPLSDMSRLSNLVGVYISGDGTVAVTTSQSELRFHHL